MKIRYTVKRENGFVFSEIFTVKEIEKGEVLKWLGANHVNPDNVIRDSCTGLKDKNDVEIYGGDILEFDVIVWGSDKDNVWAVKWDSEEGCWDTGGGTTRECSEYKKVVGTIHKNLDLLK